MLKKLIKNAIEKHYPVLKEYKAIFTVIYTFDHQLSGVASSLSIQSTKSFDKTIKVEVGKALEAVASELKLLGELVNNFKFTPVEVNLGSECVKCKKVLGNVEQMRCRECDYSLCYDCSLVDKHLHNMYYIKKDADLEVTYEPGKRKTNLGDGNPTHSGVCCDCCKGNVMGIRWNA